MITYGIDCLSMKYNQSQEHRLYKTFSYFNHFDKKAEPYFQAYSIIVPTDQPFRQVLFKLEKSGMLMAWVVELSEFEIKYRPRNTIKGQVLADFIAKFTGVEEDSEIPEQLQGQTLVVPAKNSSSLSLVSTTSQKRTTSLEETN